MGFKDQRECQRRISLQRDHFRDGPKNKGISMESCVTQQGIKDFQPKKLEDDNVIEMERR